MLIALLLQVLIASQAPAPVDVRAEMAKQDAAKLAERERVQVLSEQALKDVMTQMQVRRAACGGGMIQAGVAPGSVYRGEPVQSHPPVHVPGAYADEGVYAAVVRFGPDGCMEPVPISLPYAKPADAPTRRR